MELAGKRLLILGGASVHCKLVTAARELGVYTIVADYLEDSPAKRIADESLLISILDVDAIVEWCKEHPVDGIINYANDPAQKAHQEICQRLGLHCFGTKEQVEILTQKDKFKKACIECGVSVIPSFSLDDIRNGAVPDKEYPLLVKPVDSRGSRGQTVCYSREEVLSAALFAEKESFSGQILIEKYMGKCDDIQMSYLVMNGEPVLIKVEDRFRGVAENKLDRLCTTTVFPSVHQDVYLKKVDDKVKSMIRRLGLRDAPVFIQGFWYEDDVLMYDPGIRFPGDEFDAAYSRITGISIPKIVIKFILNGHFDQEDIEKLKQVQAEKPIVMILPCLRPGKVHSVMGLDAIENDPHVAAMTVLHEEGDLIQQTGDFKQRFAEFVLNANDFSEMRSVIDSIFTKVSVKDSLGQDMLIEKFDTAILEKYGKEE